MHRSTTPFVLCSSLICGLVSIAASGGAEAGGTKEPANSLVTKSPSDLMYEAIVERARGHYEEAIDLLTHALSLQPENARALLIRGQCLAELGRSRSAVRDLDASTRVDPQFSLAHRTLGEHYLESGNLIDAKDALSRAVAIDPNDAHAWDALGLVWLGWTKDLHPRSSDMPITKRAALAARRSFDRAVSIDSAFVAPLFHRCVTSLICQDEKACLDDLETLASMEGDRPFWQYRVGLSLLAFGLGHQAEPLLAGAREELDLDEREARSLIDSSLAEIYMGRGDFDRARGHLEELTRVGADDWQVQLWLGDVQANQGEIFDAAASYREVLENADDFYRERAVVALARLLAVQGHGEAAFRISQAGYEAGMRSPRLLQLFSALAESEEDETLARIAFTEMEERARQGMESLDDPDFLRAFSLRLANSRLEGVGSLEKACDSVQALIYASPHDEFALHRLSEARTAIEDPDRCREVLASVIELYPETPSGTYVRLPH